MATMHKVDVGYRYIRYSEGQQAIELQVDPLVSPPYAVIYVPSAERWQREMPDWIRNRRDEVLNRLKTEAASRGGAWEEY